MQQKESHPLALYRVQRGRCGNARSPAPAEQPLPALGLQRPGNRCVGDYLPFLGMAVRPGVALPPGRGSYRRCFDTEAKLTMLGKEAVEPLPLSAPS